MTLAHNTVHSELAAVRAENDLLRAQLAELRDAPIDKGLVLAKAFLVRPTGGRLLAVLMDGRPHERSWLKAVCLSGDDSGKGLDVQICLLRKVLPPDTIQTLWGHGYQMTPAGAALVRGVLKGEVA